MRFEPGHTLAVLVTALAVSTCAFPTDKSDSVFVTLEAPSLVVLRGQDMSVFARAWRVIGTDTQPIANVDFAFYTGSSSIARVEKDCCGYATVTGVNSGMVDIVARAVAFEQAGQGDLVLRVSSPVEVDSVRPTTVRYGDTITVFGVGVDSIVLASMGPVNLFPYPFSAKKDSVAGQPTGFARIQFWVPPPAHTDSLLYIGNTVFGYAKDTTRVLPFDLYEPNEVAPRDINLEQAPPIPQLPNLRFYNPALFFEPLRRDQALGVDWYRLDQTSTRDLTVILTSPEVAGNFSTFLSDSLYFNAPDTTYYLGSNAWTFGPASHACHGLGFEPAQKSVDSTVVALKGYPGPSRLDAISLYNKQGRYGLAILDQYVTSKGFNIDSHEEDDFCNAADTKLDVSQTQLSGSFTIDNPGDVDWFRFRVAALGAVRFRLQSRPFTAADTLDDVDFYVAKVPIAGDVSFNVVGQAINAGSNEDAIFTLGAGNYYLIVVDYAGVSTRYALCFAPGLTACTLAPVSPFQPAPATSRPPAVKHRSAPTAGVLAPGPKPQAPSSP
ncbi:MAG TPA: hypothetical protein VGQ25_04140 [Gemmatimonadales bacterium]|jgi:hypothetical protein|nr:hypothetical protein [Gemmatimonadales bacterium]